MKNKWMLLLALNFAICIAAMEQTENDVKKDKVAISHEDRIAAHKKNLSALSREEFANLQEIVSHYKQDLVTVINIIRHQIKIYSGRIKYFKNSEQSNKDHVIHSLQKDIIGCEDKIEKLQESIDKDLEDFSRYDTTASVCRLVQAIHSGYIYFTEKYSKYLVSQGPIKAIQANLGRLVIINQTILNTYVTVITLDPKKTKKEFLEKEDPKGRAELIEHIVNKCSSSAIHDIETVLRINHSCMDSFTNYQNFSQWKEYRGKTGEIIALLEKFKNEDSKTMNSFDSVSCMYELLSSYYKIYLDFIYPRIEESSISSIGKEQIHLDLGNLAVINNRMEDLTMIQPYVSQELASEKLKELSIHE